LAMAPATAVVTNAPIAARYHHRGLGRLLPRVIENPFQLSRKWRSEGIFIPHKRRDI
jgi:hypothetical protein